MKKGIRHAAAFGLAVALLCLSAAPAAAAPGIEERPRASLLGVHGLADQLADLFADWVRSVFAKSGCAGDPNGAPCSADLSAPPDSHSMLGSEHLGVRKIEN